MCTQRERRFGVRVLAPTSNEFVQSLHVSLEVAGPIWQSLTHFGDAPGVRLQVGAQSWMPHAAHLTLGSGERCAQAARPALLGGVLAAKLEEWCAGGLHP